MPSKERRERDRLKRQAAEVDVDAFLADKARDESMMNEPAKEQPAAFVTRPQAESDKGPKERVSFPVTADGKADWGSMQKRGKEKLVSVLKSDPEFARLLGKSAENPNEPKFEFTVKDVQLALRKMNATNGFITRFVLARYKGFTIDPDIAAQAFTMRPEDEKELAERGCRLANRYSTEWMRKHADLILFVSGYLDSVGTQAYTALMLQADRNMRKAAAAQGAAPHKANGAAAPQSEPVNIDELRG